MDNDFLKEMEEKLEKEKGALEKELGKFAEKDKNVKGDWDTKYPKFAADRSSGNQQLEESAGEVEEYMTLLPIEHSLELRLQKINFALEKIKEGKYGICKKCGKEILKERLEVSPEAEFCSNC